MSRPSSRSIASTCSLTLAAVGQAVAGGAGDWICVQGAGEVRGLDHDTGLGIDLQPVYAAIGVDLEGQKDILGMWFGDGGGESARFWMVVLTELRNRGVADVFFLVCDGLKGLPDTVNAVWPATIVQTCLIHLIRNSFRFASRKSWDPLSRDLDPIYTAINAEAAAALDDLGASGAPVIRRSSGSGATHGKSSSRS